MRISEITISRHRVPLDPPFPAAWDGRPRTGVVLDEPRLEETRLEQVSYPWRHS